MSSADELIHRQQMLDHREPPDQHGVLTVDLFEMHLHDLVRGGREVLADVVGPDRQLPVAPVDEHGQADGPGPAEVQERVEGRPDRAARVEDVVDEHDDPSVDVAGHGRGLEVARAPEGHVVPVEGDVEGPRRQVDPLEVGDQPWRSGRPAGLPGSGCPTITRSSVPLLRSTISWAMRVRARRTSSGSMTRALSWNPSGWPWSVCDDHRSWAQSQTQKTPPRGGSVVRRIWQSTRSFPASQGRVKGSSGAA